ncbi:movement protein [Sesamum angolense]|uniref:Movement protein n=1 Tax=Sesamum angolense TaxID=2727404 RepID=A0AAE1WZZ7_9LAMI|nr:movement protein [Sesamum angolense]
MDLQPSQNSNDEEDRLQTSESLSGFFSRMTVSNKTMERIMRQDSNLSPYDGFRIGGIGKVLNQIGLNQRKHHIIYKVIVCRKMMFDIHPRIAYNLADQDFSRVLTLHQDFKRKDLMKEGNRPYSITYRIAYALSNTHHSDLFLRKEYIEIPRIFKEFAKVMAPDPIRIPRIGGVDIIIKDHPVLDQTMSSRIEYGSRMSFSEDRITGYKGKEKDLARVLTPQEIRQPVIGRYEGMLEIAGHEFLVAEYFAAYIDSGSGICTAKPGVFPKEARETLPVIAGRDFSQKIIILNTGIREAKIMIGGAFGTPWFRVKTPPIYFHDTGSAKRKKAFNRIMPINFRSKRGDFDAKLTNPKMQDKRKFGKVLLSFRQQGLIDSDSLYEESEEEIKNLRKPCSPGFLVRNHGEIKRGKPRKDFRPLLKETESAKWKWEEIHTQRVRELKQVCNNLPKLAIPQDEDELVVYTDANDYRWAAVLMKRLLQGRTL